MKRLIATLLLATTLWAQNASQSNANAPSLVSTNAQTGTSYTIASTDFAKVVTFSNVGAIAVTLPQAGTAALNTGWYVYVENIGAGTVTITPTTSTIDGAATLALTQNQGAMLVSNGTNYASVRGIGGVVVGSFASNCITKASSASAIVCAGVTDDATTISTGELVSITGTGTLSIASNGTASAPFLINAGQGTNFGLFFDSTYGLTVTNTGAGTMSVGSSNIQTRSAGRFCWNADTKSNNGCDTFLERASAGVVYASATVDTADGTFKAATYINGVPANGQQESCGWNSELLTLSTSGTTTDTSANLLPANSVIKEVLARVTTTITVATSWQLGDPTTAGRFTTANGTMTSGTTDIGKVFMTTGIASATTGIWQAAAAKVRVTTVGTPGAGAIRIAVLSCVYTPPTS